MASGGRIPEPSFMEIRLVASISCKDNKLTVIAPIFSIGIESMTTWGPTARIQFSKHKQHECLIFGLDL
jgi:hypothetical protein